MMSLVVVVVVVSDVTRGSHLCPLPLVLGVHRER